MAMEGSLEVPRVCTKSIAYLLPPLHFFPGSCWNFLSFSPETSPVSHSSYLQPQNIPTMLILLLNIVCCGFAGVAWHACQDGLFLNASPSPFLILYICHLCSLGNAFTSVLQLQGGS